MTMINFNPNRPAQGVQSGEPQSVGKEPATAKQDASLKVSKWEANVLPGVDEELSVEIVRDATERNDHLGDLVRQALSYSCPPMPDFSK